MPEAAKYVIKKLAPYAVLVTLPTAAIIYGLGFNPVTAYHSVRLLLTLGGAS